jgi:hypothetical protein
MRLALSSHQTPVKTRGRNVFRFSRTEISLAREGQPPLTGLGRSLARPATLPGCQQPSGALLQLPYKVRRSQRTPVMRVLTDVLGFLSHPAGTRHESPPLLRAPPASPHLKVHQTVRGYFIAMHPGARPLVGFRLARHLRPDRIALQCAGRPSRGSSHPGHEW